MTPTGVYQNPAEADGAGRPSAVTLTDLIRIPLSRWWLVLTGAALGLAGVLGYFLLVPPTYTAAAAVTVRAVVTDPFTYPAPGAERVVNMNAEHAIGIGNDVLVRVGAAVGRTPDQVRSALRVEVPTGGQVLRFEYTAERPEQAVTGANAAAQGYLQVRQENYDAQRARILKSYDTTIQTVTEQAQAAQDALPRTAPTTGPGTPSASGAVERVRALLNQVSELAQQRTRIAAVDTAPGTVTRVAEPPVPSSRDNARLLLLAGGLGGVLVGVIAAFALESVDRRVRSVSQVAALTGVPLLGVVRRSRLPRRAAAETDARYLALSLAQRLPPDRRRVVMLSPRADPDRTRLVAALAAALAERGAQVYVGDVSGTAATVRAAIRANSSTVSAFTVASPALGMFPVQAAQGRVARAVIAPQRDAAVGPPQRDAAVGPPAQRTPVDADPPRPRPTTPVSPAAPVGGEPVLVRRDVAARFDDGAVRIGPPAQAPPGAVVIIDAPGAEFDDRGVRLALDGISMITVTLGRTRVGELRRLIHRLRSSNVEPIGCVVIGGSDG